MDFEEGADLVRRLADAHQEDVKLLSEMFEAHGKALMQALGMKV